MLNRRDFIKFVGALGSLVLTPLDRLARRMTFLTDVDTPTKGELYAGFVLLPDGAPVPAYVKPPRLPTDSACGMVEGKEVYVPKADIEYFDDIVIAANKVDFPLYTFRTLPNGLRRGKSYVVYSEELGGISRVIVDFEYHDLEHAVWSTAVSLWVQPDFPRPFPIWASEPVEPNGPSMVPEKADFLPNPGIKIATREGFMCFWIEEDVLYTMIADPSPTGQDAQTLIHLLGRTGGLTGGTTQN